MKNCDENLTKVQQKILVCKCLQRYFDKFIDFTFVSTIRTMDVSDPGTKEVMPRTPPFPEQVEAEKRERSNQTLEWP